MTIYTIYVECDDIILNCHLQPNVACNFIYTINGIWVVHVSCNSFLVANYNRKLKLLLVILGVLRLEFTIFGVLLHLCCFRICFLKCVGLDYYTNNTFNDIVINNLTKLYNITRACSFTKDYIFQTKLPFKFWRTSPCMHNFDFDGFEHYQSLALQHKNNKSHHKCTKKKCLYKFILFQLHLLAQKSKFLNT